MFSHPDDDNDDDPFLIFSPCASLDEPSVHYVDAHLQFLIIEMRENSRRVDLNSFDLRVSHAI